MAKLIKREMPTDHKVMERNYKQLYWFLRPFFAVFFPMKVLHRDRVPEGPCIIAPNHSSAADPPMACFAVGHATFIRIMAKQQLLDTPVMGWAFNRAGTFGVDRGNNDLTAIKTAIKVLKDGDKLLMFPEGSRVKEGEVSTAKTGAIMLAMRSGVPVVPCYLTRTKKLFHRSTFVFGEPYVIKPAGRRATPQEYTEQAELLLKKIYELEAEAK